MNFFHKSIVLSALLSFASVALAISYGDENSFFGPTCRGKRSFPFVSCQPQCAPYSLDVHKECLAKQQFGCLYRRCSTHNFDCKLDPQTASNNECPNGEVQVRDITLRPNFPVEFDLAVNLPGKSLDVILLIDASESTRSRLNAVKSELSSFVRQLNGIANVGVAVYGGEHSFDENGMTILSAAQEDVHAALSALEHIPNFPAGPRTTLTALHSIQRHRDELHLRYWRAVVLLIGDTPGREPECSHQLDRAGISRSLFNESTGVSVMPVSLGGTGLDGALLPLERCSNGNGPSASQPVAAGQASKLAEDTNGEVVTSVTATSLLGAIDRVRRKAHRAHQNAPGAEIYMSTESAVVVPFNYPYYPGQDRIHGCGDKVTVSLTGIPSFVSAPAEMTGKVKVDLPRGICQSGAFNCTIRVMDRVRGFEGTRGGYMYYKKIAVRAC